MAEFFQALWEACRPGPDAFLYLVLLSPFFIWAGAIFLDRRLQRDVSPPQDRKLLRPPGYSLSLELDEALESIFFSLLPASIMLVIAAAAAKATAALFGVNAPLNYIAFYGSLSVVSALPAIALMVRAWKRTNYFRNVRLGLRGEQAVAEYLHELGDVGYRSFHDLQPGKNWNIDHVVVGSQGVFLIETKARRRRTPRRQQPKHVAVYDDVKIQLPYGADTKSIPQTERNCKWLRKFLTNKTGETVHVEGIIAMPGWYVKAADNNRDYAVKVMNAQFLADHLRRKSQILPPAQVRRIITALDEQCRTLEF